MPFRNTLPVDPVTIPAGALPGTPRIVIGTVLPPPLDTYLATVGGIGDFPYKAAIILYGPNGDNNFQYIALLADAGTGAFNSHWGAVQNGVVLEQTNFGPGHFPKGQRMVIPPGAGVVRNQFTGDAFDAFVNTGTITAVNDYSMVSQLANVIISANSGAIRLDTTELLVNFRDVGLGLLVRDFQNSNSAAIAGETVAMTLPAADYRANRAYAAKLFGGCYSPSGSAGTFMLLALRKTNVGGQLLNYWHRAQLNSFNVMALPGFNAMFVVGGSDLPGVQLCVTASASAGTCAFYGAGDSPWGLEIHDIGAAADYSGCSTLV